MLMPMLRISGADIHLTALSLRRFLFLKPFPFRILSIFILFFIPLPAILAQGLVIGSGSVVSLGTGTMDFGCTDLEIAGNGQLNLEQGQLDTILDVNNTGTLNGNQGMLTFTGDWTQSGVFNAGSSTVNITDGCSSTSSTLAGATTFFNFSATTSSGKQVVFPAGLIQQVLNSLTLQGSAGNLLQIRSSNPGSPAFLQLALAGSQAISFVDVQDNHAPEAGQVLAPGAAGASNSVDSGGNFRWFLNTVTSTEAIPTLSGVALLLLILMLTTTPLISRRRP